jgi:hypothetical protein|tara:strand:- start:650 stop:898 length:249 start_codon:yes stop_codon:yes gene_type:complete
MLLATTPTTDCSLPVIIIAIFIGLVVGIFYFREKLYESRVKRRKDAISAWRKKGKNYKKRWTSLYGRSIIKKVEKVDNERKA